MITIIKLNPLFFFNTFTLKVFLKHFTIKNTKSINSFTKPRIHICLVFFLFLSFLTFGQGSGNTLTFDGSSQFIDLGDQVANQCRTIELWFKPSNNITSTISNPISLIVRDFDNGAGISTNEFGLYFYPNSWNGGIYGGKLVFSRRVTSTNYEIGSDGNFWEANHWYHVSVTIESTGGMKMYINGVLQQDTNSSVSPIGTQSGTQWDRVAIGRWGSQNIRFFQGEIDEVRFWETARTQQQVRDKMCGRLSGNEPNLRAYYNFDSGNGTTLLDNSSNNFNGTLQAMNNSNWIYSGAPIGDTSTHTYQSNITGVTSILSTSAGDEFTVSNINSTAEGIQIYKVNSLPNVLTNLNSPSTNNYYGIFLSSTNGTYSVNYKYNDYGCSSCDEILARNDNAELIWQQVTASPQNCTFNLYNESSIGYEYRSEYIINTGESTHLTNFLGNDTTMCTGNYLTLDPQILNATFLWQDNSTESTFTLSQPGQYWVQITTDCSVFTDTIQVDYINPPSISLGSDTLICLDTQLLLEPEIVNVNFLWQDNSINTTYTATQTGVYSLEVSNICGEDSDTIYIEFNSPPIVFLGNDTIICSDETIVLETTATLCNYLWQDGSTNSSYSISQTGLYWLEVSNDCGLDIDSIQVTIQPIPIIQLGNDTTLCEGTMLTLEPSIQNEDIIWQDGSIESNYIVDQTGVYFCTVSSDNCSTSDTIIVSVLAPPNVNLGSDTIICEDENLILYSEGIGSYSWSTGSSEPNLIVNTFGEYIVSVSNQCGTTKDTINIQERDCSCTYYVPNTFTPDGNKFNEEFGMVYNCTLYNFEIKIYNRWGHVIFESYDPTLFWNGTYQNKLVQTGIYTYKIEFETDNSAPKTITGHIHVLY
jgi:gliding motility-associated-like protein